MHITIITLCKSRQHNYQLCQSSFLKNNKKILIEQSDFWYSNLHVMQQSEFKTLRMENITKKRGNIRLWTGRICSKVWMAPSVRCVLMNHKTLRLLNLIHLKSLLLCSCKHRKNMCILWVANKLKEGWTLTKLQQPKRAEKTALFCHPEAKYLS